MGAEFFFDYASTSFLCPKALKMFSRQSQDGFANVSSMHPGGMRSQRDMEEAKEILADDLGVSSSTIYFTSGATESNNLILKGIAEKYNYEGQIITSPIEHKCIVETCAYLKNKGVSISYLPVDSSGRILYDELPKLLTEDTLLVSVMHANNELGTFQPVDKIAEMLRDSQALFHVDAAQTFGKYKLSIDDIGADFISFSGHKFYGPKGIGGLYARNYRTLVPHIHGGGQQDGLRSGTVNLPGITAMATAFQVIRDKRTEYDQVMTEFRDYVQAKLLTDIPDTVVLNKDVDRLSNVLHVCFEGIDNGALMTRLGYQGICVSTGSSCASGSAEVSHVLRSIKTPDTLARGALRISFGWSNTQESVDFLIQAIVKQVADLRVLSG